MHYLRQCLVGIHDDPDLISNEGVNAIGIIIHHAPDLPLICLHQESTRGGQIMNFIHKLLGNRSFVFSLLRVFERLLVCIDHGAEALVSRV